MRVPEKSREYLRFKDRTQKAAAGLDLHPCSHQALEAASLFTSACRLRLLSFRATEAAPLANNIHIGSFAQQNSGRSVEPSKPS